MKKATPIETNTNTCVRLSLLARAAAIFGATFLVRLDIRRSGLEFSSSISADPKLITLKKKQRSNREQKRTEE